MTSYRLDSPLEIYERVQFCFRHAIVASRGEALKTVQQMLNSSPRVVPYWLLPIDTPACARVWLSPKRRVA